MLDAPLLSNLGRAILWWQGAVNVKMLGPEVLLPLIIIGLLLWLLVIRPNRRRKAMTRGSSGTTTTRWVGTSGVSHDGPRYEPGPTHIETGALDVTDLYSGTQNQLATWSSTGLPPEGPYRGVAAGFYIDPLDHSRERYWDGEHWNDETDPRSAKTPFAPPPPSNRPEQG